MNFLEEEDMAFFSVLQKNGVRFLLVGGIAVNYYGYSRSTGDIDIWLEDTRDNRSKLVHALSEYGLPGAEIFHTHPLIAGFSEILLESGIYVDMMASLQFFKQELFSESYEQSEMFVMANGVPLKIIQLNRLIEEKKKSPRPKDRDDAVELEKIRSAGRN